MYEMMTLPFRPAMRRCAPYPFRGMEEFFGMPEHKMPAPFSVDVIDEGENYLLKADLPGFTKENIDIRVEDDLLSISAERKFEENEDKPDYVRHERFYGSYKRSFNLEGINADAIEASYNDGVLSLKLPKLPDEKPAPKTIEIQ